MKNIFLMVLCSLFAVSSFADDKIKVVATLSTFGDVVKQIGGDYVEVSSIASPKFNPHFIEPKPSDVFKLKKADLFAYSGLDLEAWKDPLVTAAGNPEFRQGGNGVIDLSQGLNLLEVPDRTVSRAEGDIHQFGNPHYWLDPSNALHFAETIRDKLSEKAPEHKADFEKNFQQFKGRLTVKIKDWKTRMQNYSGSEFVGYHNEWVYLMQFLGLKMKEFLEPKPGIPPTPKQLIFLESYIKENKIKGVIQPTFYPVDSSEALTEKTGVPLLKIAQNVSEVSQAEDYFSLIEFDVSEIEGALKK